MTKKMNLDAAGDTLVELLVTIVVIGITFASIAYLFISIENVQRQTTYLDLATRAAQQEVEALRTYNYLTNLTNNVPIDFSGQLPADLPAGSTGTVQVVAPSTDLRRIDVAVTYSFAGSPHTVTLSALIGAIGLN
jgi:type II secretory pathway pseudopilin PulG